MGLFPHNPQSFLLRMVHPYSWERRWVFFHCFKVRPWGLGCSPPGSSWPSWCCPSSAPSPGTCLQLVPPVVKESAFGMGATTWEVTYKVTIPYGLVGIIGAGFMGLGRALGETMAVTFVIGNAHRISASLFAPGNTIASTLANEFSEATEPLYVGSLVALGLVLYLITYLVQVVAQMMLRRMLLAPGV